MSITGGGERERRELASGMGEVARRAGGGERERCKLDDGGGGTGACEGVRSRPDDCDRDREGGGTTLGGGDETTPLLFFCGIERSTEGPSCGLSCDDGSVGEGGGRDGVGRGKGVTALSSLIHGGFSGSFGADDASSSPRPLVLPPPDSSCAPAWFWR